VLDRCPRGTRLATRCCTGGEQNNAGWLTPLWLVTSSDATAAGIFTLSLPIPFDSPVIPANRLEPISRHYRADNFQPTSGCSVRRIGASRTASKRRIIQSHYDEDTTDEETNLWHTRHSRYP
jgi:hypothetical protein